MDFLNNVLIIGNRNNRSSRRFAVITSREIDSQ